MGFIIIQKVPAGKPGQYLLDYDLYGAVAHRICRAGVYVAILLVGPASAVTLCRDEDIARDELRAAVTAGS